MAPFSWRKLPITLIPILLFVLFSIPFLFLPAGADLISSNGDAAVGGVIGMLFGVCLIIDVLRLLEARKRKNGTFSNQSRKVNGFIGKILTREDARKVIVDCVGGFYVFATFIVILGFLANGFTALIAGAVFAGLAFLLKKKESRVAAWFLFLLSLIMTVESIANSVTKATGGQNELLGFVMIWIGARAIQATWVMKKKGTAQA